MKYGPFPMRPAFPTSEYYDPLRLPLDRPLHFPGSPVIGGASLPATPQATGPRRLSRVPRTTIRTFSAPIRRRVPQRPLLEQGRFPWPSPCADGLGSLLTHPQAGPLDDASPGLHSRCRPHNRSRPAPHPASRPRTGASLPGTQASPRTGLTPAGRPELIASTSCRSPFLHGAEAVSAHPRIGGGWSDRVVSLVAA